VIYEGPLHALRTPSGERSSLEDIYLQMVAE
jgi:hypothetical protein